jgi:hypothetical protein
MMNFEGKSKIDEPVLQAKGLRNLPFIIFSSLFDIHYSIEHNATRSQRANLSGKTGLNGWWHKKSRKS